LCSVCSPVSNNVQHPILLQPDITYGIILIHTICSLWMCRDVQSRNYYEILWITNTMNYYELLWFTDIFVLWLYVFLGNLSFSWVVYCRMLSFWSPLSPLPLVASRVEDHRSEEKKHSTYVQIISVNLVKWCKVM
jgi:hypothetical protein